MGIYDDIKQSIISKAEALYSSDNATYGALKAALGDVGSGPNWNTVTLSGVEFLAGSTFNPKKVGTDPGDGPETDNIDNTVMSIILKGIADSFIESTISIASSTTIISGHVVSYTSAKQLQLSDADGGSRQKNPIGVATTSAILGGAIDVHTRPGQQVPIIMDSIPSSTANGELVFLSTTAGNGTLTAPAAVGDRVYVLGILSGADGVTASPTVLWAPGPVILSV